MTRRTLRNLSEAYRLRLIDPGIGPLRAIETVRGDPDGSLVFSIEPEYELVAWAYTYARGLEILRIAESIVASELAAQGVKL